MMTPENTSLEILKLSKEIAMELIQLKTRHSKLNVRADVYELVAEISVSLTKAYKDNLAYIKYDKYFTPEQPSVLGDK